MKQTQEVLDYEKDFGEETIDILAVTGANGFGGGRDSGEKYWTSSIALTSWRENGEAEVHTGEFRLTTKADDEELAALQATVKEDQMIRVKVRRKGNSFLIVEPPVAAEDPVLEKNLREQVKVLTITDEMLGTFTLDRSVNWYEREIVWLGETAMLNFDYDEADVMRKQLDLARVLYQNQSEWDRRVRKCAAEELLELKNENWCGDDEEEVTEEAFISRLKLEGITIRPGGEFEFWFRDGDLFWGHSIFVSGNLEEGPKSADLAG